jgi:hypothetical protein
MPTPEEIQKQQELLAVHRSTLAHYLEQEAALSAANTRPEISLGIRETRAEIARIKAILRGWGVVVEDHPDDGDEPAPPPEPAAPINRPTGPVHQHFDDIIAGYKMSGDITATGISGTDVVIGHKAVVVVDRNMCIIGDKHYHGPHAVARLKNIPENNQLLIEETCILEAGILKERPQVPGFETTPVNLPDHDEVPIDITVYVEGMTIKPNWIQRFTFYKKKESDLVEFQLTPQTTGKKQIRVEFYYERHWLAKITFDVEVVEAEIGVVSTSSSSLETTNIRPPVHQNYPVDMHIRIYPQGSRYGAEISVPGQVQRIPIAMSSHDLVVLNQHLQERILAIASGKLVRHQPGLLERAKTFFRKPVQPATFCSTNPEAKLRLLAETGYYAFKKVFSDPNVRVFMKSILTLGTRISIQITTEDFFLPWELLYPVSLDEPLSYQHFWGMNYVISRIIVRDFQPGCFVPPNIPIDTIPRLGLLTYTKLPGVSTGEIPFFDRLHCDSKVQLFKLRSLDPNKKQTEFKEFQAFWSHELNLAHFACHAVYEDGAPDMSHLMLSDEFPITLMDMEVYGVVTSNHPLIVMNACETGNLNPLYTSHFAAAFLKYGARGVVATECAVPDDFAARFAEQLYTRLLAGKPLGESLLATRRYFWKKHNDPSGLLYSMYAAPNIRLVRG